MSVVLPEPFSPTSASFWPGRTWKDDAVERRTLAARIRERDRLEAEAVAWTRADGARAGRRRDRRLEELVERREVEVVLVHAADRRERRAERRLALLEDEHVHGHRAET